MLQQIEILRNIFERNDDAARQNRAALDDHGVVCLNLLGGAGSGKTSFLELALPALSHSVRVAVLEGDLATTRDAERIARLNVPVLQLLTEGGCHLNATLVQHAIEKLPLDALDLLIIENVGNPICPANFDLGEHGRISVLSTTEGDDKPQKYPLLFRNSDLVLITKGDLLPYVAFSVKAASDGIRRISPHTDIIQTETRFGSGMVEAADWLRRFVRDHKKVFQGRTKTPQLVAVKEGV